MIKAVTFDLFDTLAPAADFDRGRQQTLYRFMCEHVCEVTFERFKEVERRHMAERFSYICRTLNEVVYNDRFPLLFRELSGREPDTSLVEKASEATCRAMGESLEVPDYIPPFLERLSESYKLALISNFPIARPILEGLERTGIRKYFSSVVVSSDFGLTKPHPAIFKETYDQLGVDVSETVHVGDDWACDVLGAANTGSVPVYLTQFKDEEKIRLSGNRENMLLLCSHLNVDPEMDGVIELKDITRLPEAIQAMGAIGAMGAMGTDGSDKRR